MQLQPLVQTPPHPHTTGFLPCQYVKISCPPGTTIPLSRYYARASDEMRGREKRRRGGGAGRRLPHTHTHPAPPTPTLDPLAQPTPPHRPPPTPNRVKPLGVLCEEVLESFGADFRQLLVDQPRKLFKWKKQMPPSADYSRPDYTTRRSVYS